MTPKKIKTKQEEKAAARDYLKKAGDNHDAMLSEQRKWNFPMRYTKS